MDAIAYGRLQVDHLTNAAYWQCQPHNWHAARRQAQRYLISNGSWWRHSLHTYYKNEAIVHNYKVRCLANVDITFRKILSRGSNFKWWRHRHAYLLTYLLTLLSPWNRFLFEKLTVPQLVNKFPSFMESEGSLPHSYGPATCPYTEPDQSSPCLPIPLPEDPP
jgi:hypothetical protein